MLEQKLIRGRGVTLAGAALFCRLSLGLGLVFAGALSGCKGTAIRPSALDSEVHEYVRLAVGLGQRDADSLDYYSGSGASVADTMQHPPSLKALHRSTADLLASVEREQPASEEGKARRAFLLRQLQAMAARIDLIEGVPSSFDAETKASFGVVIPASYDRPDVASVQAELQKLLPGKETLAERYQAFDNRFIVQPKLLSVVMDRAIAGCRATTQQHVTLPAGEAVTVEYVRNKPWSAYSWYKGGFHSVIQVNRDFALTVDRVMNLACHEAYPGHHTYNSIRDAELVRGKGLQEYSVQPTFSPQSMISESIANLATDVAFPADKRLAFERDVLFPLAGLDSKDAALYLRVEALVDRLHMVEPSVAREYLDGRLEFERAGAELESGALMVHPEAALLYMNEYRSYVATYTYGRDLVTAELQRRSGGDADMQWKIYRQWMNVDPKLEGMHSETAKGMTLSHAGGG